MNAYKVDEVILTAWDDSDELLEATIKRVYRGHRNWRYEVEMEDGTIEVIDEDQIIC